MPNYSKQILATQRRKKIELMKITDIMNLGKDYIQAQVIIHANIKSVDETRLWFFNICTGCKGKIEMKEKNFICEKCNRRIPQPEKKFQLAIVASDETAEMEISLGDREVRTLIGQRAHTGLKENKNKITFPKILQTLTKKNVTIQLLIKEDNVLNKAPMYWASNICNGFYIPEDDTTQTTQTMQQTTSQVSQ
ncbi:hypothetical protein POM88_049765 [Heracleum sosnowskyi]|uniref:Replication factor A C-terminal domain-containing protein n=1 Tax=Heracleum sosnowskyi TaxID=360622 RepID=A0AAD8M1P9_9APIA|nr:hypothetical protein POM88_049765 [Heracleum sosnowskyi]